MLPRRLIVLMAVLTSGCVAAVQPHQDRLFQQNRFGELGALMEPKVAAKASARTGELVYLCSAYSRTRAYDKLFPCLDRMQAKIGAGDISWNGFDVTALPHLLRAQAQLELGDVEQAVSNAEAGYEKSEIASKWMQITGRGILSLVYAQAGRLSDANRIAAQLAGTGTGYPYTFLASDKYNALARTRMALGDWKGALDALDRDNTGVLKGVVNVVVGTALTGDSIFDYVDLPRRFMRARALMELDRIDEARVIYDALLASPDTEQNSDLLWIILDDRGRIAQAQGDLSGAEQLFRRAVRLVELQRASIRAESGRIGFAGDKQGLYRRFVRLLLARGAVSDAFIAAEQAKSRALLDLLGTRNIGAAAKSAPVARLVTKLRDAQTAELELGVNTGADSSRTRSASVSALANELRNAAPEVASLVTVSVPALSQIQSQLGPNETLVEYFGGNEDLVAFVVTRAKIEARSLNPIALADEVGAFRKEIQDPDADPQRRARLLHDRLFAPLEDLVDGNRLLIVPHGSLHYLPFSALRGSQQYLIDRYTIRMLPAASVLQFLANGGPANDRLLLFGDPDVGDSAMDLPGAQEEVRAIHALWPSSTVLVRGQASKEAMMRLASDYRRLHFATHGAFRSDAPLRSGLLLSPGDQRGGLLTVGDLYSLNLDVDLVTLSACETGLGTVYNGDDVVGLSRGFLFAGSRSIVASLWKVSDEATRDLMVSFYEGLAQGQSKREALRNAQLRIKEHRPEPFFWAAFQLTGAD